MTLVPLSIPTKGYLSMSEISKGECSGTDVRI